MCKFIKTLGLLLLMHVGCLAQQNQIEIEWQNDTAWHVNPKFDSHSPTFDADFVFPAEGTPIGYDQAEIIAWGDNSTGPSWTLANGQKMRHTYTKAGVYELQIKLTSDSGKRDTIFHKKIMNRGLETTFEVRQSDKGKCIEWGGDTVRVRITGLNNPPQTDYQIVVDSKAEGLGSNDSLYHIDVLRRPDSANIIFEEPTGSFGAVITVLMTCEINGLKLEVETTTSEKVYVYHSPDIRKMYQFADTITPAGPGLPLPELENFKICIPDGKGPTLNLEILKKYQYKSDMGWEKATPYYKGISDNQDFEISYFYADSLWEKNTPWKPVSGDLTYADTSANIEFKKSGFYKIKIVAWNPCGIDEHGTILKDSLWTDSVKNEAEKRYYQVYEAAEDKLLCRQDTACVQQAADTIIITDANVRRSYEEAPTYTIAVTDSESNVVGTYTKEIVKWQGGKKIPHVGGEVDTGCDSTVIRLKFSKSNKYSVSITRNTECGEINKVFTAVVGDVPDLLNQSVSIGTDLMNTYGITYENNVLWRCDTFRYKLRKAEEMIDTNFFALDSVMFAFQRGNVRDTVVNYADASFLFDSTANKLNYIRVSARNYCGWNRKLDSAAFYTYAKPDVSLLRDSVVKNDSLCIAFEYPYYLVGTFPQNYTVDLNVTGGKANIIYVDGIGYQGGPKELKKSDFRVFYYEPGYHKELFTIINTDQPACKQVLDEEFLYTIAAPDTLIFKDSVRYCEDLMKLNTKQLFKTDESDFKWGEWTWNKTNSKEKFPEFTYSHPLKDTLYSSRHNSKGCFLRDTLVFISKIKPVLNLPETLSRCLPDTVKMDEYPGLWGGGTTSLTTPGIALKVYREKIADENLMYGYSGGAMNYARALVLTGLAQDSVRLIYKLYNEQTDPSFAATCEVVDTLKLVLFRPHLNIDVRDTINYPWTEYPFNRLTGKVDTADVLPTGFKWSSSGKGLFNNPTGLYTAVYQLDLADQGQDSLVFRLSATTVCGETLVDSLVVSVSHVKLDAYTDTICRNTEGYPLWEKISSQFVDTATVAWEIIYPTDLSKQGTLSAAVGKNVLYTPYSAGEAPEDSIRIAVKGIYTVANNLAAHDTIVLKINPAPFLHFNVDTLIASGREIDITKIKTPDYLSVSNSIGLAKGDVVAGENGSWKNNTVFQFAENKLNFADNLWRKVEIQALGLRGCAAAKDTVVFLDLVYPKVTFKRELEEICSGDELKMDTIYTATGIDKYTRFKWSLEGGGLNGGEFNRDTTYYIAKVPEDHIQTMKVTTFKNYTCYDGTSKTGELRVTDQALPIVVHREPMFTLNHPYDTLCRAQSEITLERDWVDVTQSLYPDYRDSLRLNGLPFTEDRIHALATEGQKDMLVLTVSQGRCTKWDTKKDTIFLYRLPHMVTGTFAVDPVCEDGMTEVKITPTPLVGPLAKTYRWTAEGGTLQGQGQDQDYTPQGYGSGEGSVTLHVQPPYGCVEDTLRAEFQIFHLPEITLQDDTVCRIIGQTVNIPVSAIFDGNRSEVQKIEWFHEGFESDILQTTTGTTPMSYQVTAADSVAGVVDLVAKVWAMSPCTTLIYDTVKITLQNLPAITLPATPISMCQGGQIDLATKVTIQDHSAVAWSKGALTTGDLTGSVYSPKELWGPASFWVKAAGKQGCPERQKEVAVNVGYAPKPEILVITPVLCQLDTLRFEVRQPEDEAVVGSYAWNFGDLQSGVGRKTGHVYGEENTYTVTLQATYTNSCVRTVDKEISVNRKPEALFVPEPQVALGALVVFTSLSKPAEDINQFLWTFEEGAGGTSIVSPCMHAFTGGGSGYRKVALQVTTMAGCRDTVSHPVLVVAAPEAKFTLEVDSCSGVVKIHNLSTRNFAEVSWDFGNATSPTPDWDPQDQSYGRIFRDTVYQISLTLTNAADVSSVTLPVKMISKLEAKVEEVPVSDVCNKLDKEIHIQTRGKADTTEVWWGDGHKEKWTNEQNIQLLRHRYENATTAPKYFPLRLVAMNACKKDTTSPVSVRVDPLQLKARVILDTNSLYRNECYGHDRGFENKSFGFAQAGYHCEWTFGDQSDIVSDNGSKVKHLFEKPGKYRITLRVSDNCYEDQDTVSVTVHGNDSLDFAWTKEPLCTGKEIGLKFVQRGEKPFGDFRWEFDDGTKKAGSQTTVTFDPTGNQTIKLTASAEGCKTEASRTIWVNTSPDPYAGVVNDMPTTGCCPFTVKLKGGSFNNQPFTAFWDFKDNTFADTLIETKIFADTGVYNVSLRLTTTAGCIDSAIVPIKVLYTPEIAMDLSARLFCTDEGTFEVVGINKSADKADCSFSWWKGEEKMPVLNSDTCRFAVNAIFGKIGIALKAVHQTSLCPAWIRDTVTSSYKVKPQLTLLPEKVCEGNPVVFSNTSGHSDFMNLSLGDGTENVVENNFEHIYDNVGSYRVKLVVANIDGCRDSLEYTVVVNPLPLPEFSWEIDNTLTGLPDTLNLPDKDNGGVRFINHSQVVPEGDTLKYKWFFGDSTALSVKKSPVHRYAGNGNYDVLLITETGAGCRDSVTDIVHISAVKGLYVPTAFAPAMTNDEGISLFQPKGIGLFFYKIRIYDQWGTCVWMSEKLADGHPEEAWDGTFNGEPLPGGTYKWTISALFQDGSKWDENGGRGTVILIR